MGAGRNASYIEALTRHYERTWRKTADKRRWGLGPIADLPEGFCVLEFPPGQGRGMWTYATCAMSAEVDEMPVELHLFSLVQADDLVELLTVVAHYHHTGARLALGHTVNFGRPWLPGSACSFGLISLPYLDGPTMEIARAPALRLEVRCLWLIPITARELGFKKRHGLESLERVFDASGIDYADPYRSDQAPPD